MVFSIPAVQTGLGKYATKRLNKDFGTNINIGKVGLQLDGDVELKNIYIEDFRKDTLIFIAELNTSVLSLKNLYNNKLTFGDIDIKGLDFNIKTYKGEKDTNLDIFVARFDDEQPRKEKSDFLLSSSDVTIEDSSFKITDENKENPVKLDFKFLNISSTNFLIEGPDVSTKINSLSFMDERGVEVKEMKSDFLYTLSGMKFNELSIKTNESEISGNLAFSYARENLQYFTDQVKLEAKFTNSTISLKELNTFYNEFGKEIADFNAELSGTLNDLQVDNLQLKTSRNTKVYGNFNFKNLFNPEEDNFKMKGDFSKLSSNYNDLTSLMPNVLGASIPSSFKKFGNFNIKGIAEITSKLVKTNTNISTELGIIDSQLELNRIDDIDNASYMGKIIVTDFLMGDLLNNEKLGKVSFNLNVEGKSFLLEKMNTEAQGDIFDVDYNGYNYRDFEVSGTFENKKFNGKFNSNDKNLKLDFIGLADFSEEIYNFDFVADVDYANLNALNFVTRDSLSIFKGMVEMKMKATSIEDAYGDIKFNNTFYQNQNDSYFFKDFAITAGYNDKKERLVGINSPDIIQGKLSGKFLFRDLGKMLENSMGSIYTNYVPNEINSDQYIDFNFKIYNKIVEVFVPDIELSPNTFIRGSARSNDNDFKLTFKSPKIKLFDYFADNIQLNINNKNPLFNTYVQVDSLNTKFYNVSDFNLINVTLKDTLFIRSEFKGGKRNDDSYKLSLYYTINEENKSVLGFKKSNVTFRDNKWFVNENRDKHNKIIFDRDFENFEFDKLLMNHEDEEIKLSGMTTDSAYKDIKLDFTNVDLAKITPELDSLRLNGTVNGKLDILQKNGEYLPNSTVIIDDFKVNDYNLGSFDANIFGNQSLTNYEVDISIKDDVLQSFKAEGNIDVSKKSSTIDVDITLNEFDLKPLNPLGEDVINRIRGLVTGNAFVTGKLSRPSIEGNLTLDQAGLQIPYLNVDYSFQDKASVSLQNQSFIFNNVEMTDSYYNSKARLNGDISHINFSDWSLGLNISTDKLLVLNTKPEDEVLYYGTGFIGGTANIKGPTDQLIIKVDGQTREGTEFKIPLNDTESYGDNSYIHFLTKEEKESKISGEEIVFEEIKGLELDFDLDVNEDAEVEIIIDPKTGHSIKGRGAGNLLVEINTNGKFNMWGDFLTFEGIYNFIYGGIIQKQFIVEPGGTITWEGDPLKAEIDLKAIYKTQANPSILLDNPINRSIPVDVVINLTGQLEQPDPTFDLKFPNVSTAINSELQYRLDDNESRELQALSVVTSGTFVSEVNISQQALTGNLAERASAIVNSLFSDGEGKLKVGINYQSGQRTPELQTDDRLGLTLSTQVSERILINGKVGVPIGGVSETVIAGDVQIDFLLNDKGTLTAKMFNRENSIRNFGEEIGYTQGLGLSYNVDFDTFKELLEKIFKGKTDKDKNEESSPTDDDLTMENPLPDFVNFRSENSN
ncbi:MAG: translocation/assembly module TamB [Bacteroidia bacterium]|nr:translocation/assembly module TamB [Bacteroidia bacterium]